jgi:hypothetical protein
MTSIAGNGLGQSGTPCPRLERVSSLSMVAYWVYKLAAAGETLRKPPENYPTSIEGWKNREKRNANPH